MLTYRTRRMFHSNHSVGGSLVRFIETPFKFPFLTIIFILLLTISSAAFATSMNLLPSAVSNPFSLLMSVLVAVSSLCLMSRIVQKLAVRQLNAGVSS